MERFVKEGLYNEYVEFIAKYKGQKYTNDQIKKEVNTASLQIQRRMEKNLHNTTESIRNVHYNFNDLEGWSEFFQKFEVIEQLIDEEGNYDESKLIELCNDFLGFVKILREKLDQKLNSDFSQHKVDKAKRYISNRILAEK